MRKQKEVYIDYILLLYLLHYCQEKKSLIDGPLKLQKLVFISELNMTNKSEKGLHFKFFRYNYGPYSKELAEDHKELKNLGLVSAYRTSNKGIEILKLLWDAIQAEKKNSDITHEITEAIDRYGKYAGSQLVNMVYNMKMEPHDMPGHTMRIKDIPTFTDLIVPEVFEASIKFDISDELLNIFEEELQLSDKARERINKQWPAYREKGEKKLQSLLSTSA